MPIETICMQADDPVQGREAVDLAARYLREGRLVVIPTETVYGIGANAFDESAVDGIFAAKGRPQDNPLIAHIADSVQLDELVSGIPEQAKLLVQRFWPGPLTVVLPKSGRVPNAVSAGLDTVAVRMPSHPVAREIIRRAGVPVAAPSANRSGSPSPTTAQHAWDDLGGRVDLIVDAGPCAVGLESTVLSLAGGRPRLLRPGAVTLEQLRELLGEVDEDAGVSSPIEEGAPAASPGMKYRHYAPKAQIILVNATPEQFRRFLKEQTQPGTWALVFTEDAGDLPVPAISYGSRSNAAEQAQQLFSALRKLDEHGAVKVYACTPDPNGVGKAVYNRLQRAAGFRQIDL